MRLLVFVAVLGCGGSAKPVVPAGSGSGGATVVVPAAHRLPQQSSDVHVVIDGGAIRFNGVAVSPKPRVADITAIYGSPDRVWDSGGANRIHTWDKLGLLVYEPYDTDGKTGDGRCISATFPYKSMTTSFSPKTLFAGTIELDKRAFGPNVTLREVLRWPGATQPYTGQSIVFDREDFHVFTLEESDVKKGGLDLVEFSFWQKREVEKSRRPTPRVVDIDEDDCKTGDVQRCSNRALALQIGTGGRRNLERAFELVKIACAGGDVFGCMMLGNMYDAGKGTAANKPEAQLAWKRACTLGYKPAC